MTDRPANPDDMRLFWPDKTDDELQAAAAAITAAGGVMTISPDPDSDDWPDYDTDEDED